ncbi:MAG: MobF family relaxase [Vicinamibacterales bacterium]
MSGTCRPIPVGVVLFGCRRSPSTFNAHALASTDGRSHTPVRHATIVHCLHLTCLVSQRHNPLLRFDRDRRLHGSCWGAGAIPAGRWGVTVRVTSLKGAGAGEYYVAEPGGYYLAAGEPPGRWFGDGAARLGLDASVDDAAFVSVLAGIDPSAGVELGRAFGEGSVRGYDVTFSAPKSVSLLAALGDPAVQAEVHAAHDAAVDAVLGYIERHALTRFRVDGEVVSVDAEGIVAGVFRQHVSRELDPQLHTHAVIANRVLSPDGRWLALDARPLMKDQTMLSALYHAGLRAELTSRLGVGWGEVDNGIAELAGVEREVLDAFSQRSSQVTSRLAVKLARFRETMDREPTGRERWRLEREAAVDSRRCKPAAIDAAALQQRWQAQLGELGLDRQTLVDETVGRVLEPAMTLDVDPWGGPAEAALSVLTESRSTWRRPDVLREFARATPTDTALPAGELIAGLEAAVGPFEQEWLMELARPLPEGVAVRASDGRPAWESPLERRYTTSYILEEEADLADWAHRRWTQLGRTGVVETTGLDHAQVAAARAVAGDAGLVVVVGPAGAGKTTALRPGIKSLVWQGRPMFAVAPTATAAAVLAEETGVAADTIDKLLLEHRRPGGPTTRYHLPRGGTLLVDEAAMVATPTLAELARLADRQSWRVVLVGDPLQFLPVGRAGMFDWLVEHGPTIELDRIHRFTEPWERDASLALRTGQVDALALYEQHGRLHESEPGEVDFDVIDHWAHLRAEGHSVAVLAANNDTVHRLNHLAQQHRIDIGELDPNGPAVHTEAGYRLLVGDQIATRRNDRQLRTDRGEMVRNRDHWRIDRIEHDGAIVASGRPGTARLPAEYVDGHVELAYAQTGHAAQGRTVDHSLLVVDGSIDNRGVYVPLTRGRHANHAYVALEPDDPRTARDVLAEAVNRDWADVPATVYRHQLEQLAPSGRQPAAISPLALEAAELRLLAGEVARIEALAVPFSQRELRRDLNHAATERAQHQQALATLAEAKAKRDRIAERLAELSPWNPFHTRERRQLETDNRTANRAVARHRHTLDDSTGRVAAAEARVAERQAWLDRHQPDHDRLPGLYAELDRDLDARIERAGIDPPSRWAINVLGARPDRAELAELWDHTVGRVEQYRTIHSITSDHDAIDVRPQRGSLAHAQWTSVAADVGEAAHFLGREPVLDPHVRHNLRMGPERNAALGHGISM